MDHDQFTAAVERQFGHLRWHEPEYPTLTAYLEDLLSNDYTRLIEAGWRKLQTAILEGRPPVPELALVIGRILMLRLKDLTPRYRRVPLQGLNQLYGREGIMPPSAEAELIEVLIPLLDAEDTDERLKAAEVLARAVPDRRNQAFTCIREVVRMAIAEDAIRTSRVLTNLGGCSTADHVRLMLSRVGDLPAGREDMAIGEMEDVPPELVPEAVAYLRRFVRHDDGSPSLYTLRYLALVAPGEVVGFLPVMLDELRGMVLPPDGDAMLRLCANDGHDLLGVLTALGPHSRPTWPVLRDMLDRWPDSDEYLGEYNRLWVTARLGRLDTDYRAEAIAMLRTRLSHPQSLVWREAIRYLMWFDEPPTEMIPRFVSLAEDRVAAVGDRLAVACVLRWIGHVPAGVTDAVREMTRDPDESIRFQARIELQFHADELTAVVTSPRATP